MNRLPPDSPSSVASERSSQTKGIPQPEESAADGATAAQTVVVSEGKLNSPYNPRFIQFLRLLAEIEATAGAGKLFPKQCRVCEKEFDRFSEYLCATTPKGHVFEDCKEVMGMPFTMMYRHCPCGNTLVLSLTEQTFPALDLMWAMLHDEANASGLPLQDVVKEFSQQCDHYVLHRDDS